MTFGWLFMGRVPYLDFEIILFCIREKKKKVTHCLLFMRRVSFEVQTHVVVVCSGTC